jgi:hypothetical protein
MSEGGAGIDLDLSASIAAAVGRGVSLALERDHQRRVAEYAELTELVYPFNIDPQPLPANGVLDVPRLLGPIAGFSWQVDRLTAQGYSAGTVIVWVNAVVQAGAVIAGEQLFQFPSAGAQFQRHMRMMRYGERLVVSASGLVASGAGPAFTVGGWQIAERVLGRKGI